jgi:hypothetical protein
MGGIPRLPSISPSCPVRFQELPRAYEKNAPKRFKLSKVFVSRDHYLSFRFDGTFENTVVRFILSDEIDRFFRVDELGELLDGSDGLARARGRPLKFAN